MICPPYLRFDTLQIISKITSDYLRRVGLVIKGTLFHRPFEFTINPFRHTEFRLVSNDIPQNCYAISVHERTETPGCSKRFNKVSYQSARTSFPDQLIKHAQRYISQRHDSIIFPSFPYTLSQAFIPHGPFNCTSLFIMIVGSCFVFSAKPVRVSVFCAVKRKPRFVITGR